jgi:AAA+ ATPase superfamily predicted ATPase
VYIGRGRELSLLNDKFALKEGQLVAVYGRRRIGKSSLIAEFAQEKFKLQFEGLEKRPTSEQIDYFVSQLAIQTNDKFLGMTKLQNWNQVFEVLTDKIKNNKQKTVIIFDEIQWMAAGQSKLISLIKAFWDLHWKASGSMLILCGSVAHYMIDGVIKSKALYGRINLQINLTALPPNESRQFFKRKNEHEILLYLMIFGGVPKYLEEINLKLSFEQNINQLCFQKDGYFISELEKIFYAQFLKGSHYIQIVKLLSNNNLSLSELSAKLKISTGGGLRRYMINLENAGFVRSFPSTRSVKKVTKYKLFDEYLIFYFKFMSPYIKTIEENTSRKLFNTLVEKKWTPWLGIAFETFCNKNALYISEKCGFHDYVLNYGPLFGTLKNNYQIDLSYARSDSFISVCEIKYSDKKIGTEIIPEFEKKIEGLKKDKLLLKKSVQRILITTIGADQSLLKSQYFDIILTLDEILS